MTEKDILRRIYDCAILYNQNLENKNIMFIFKDGNKIDALETAYYARNFLHLTGLDVLNRNIKTSSNFYRNLLDGKINTNDFGVPHKGIIDMKLTILPQLMSLHKKANMIGDYNFTKIKLHTDKFAGSVTACMGFIRDDNYYIPNTSLNEDIRKISQKPKRIIASLLKDINVPLYNQLTYVAKGTNLRNLILPNDIYSKIDFNNLFVDTKRQEINNNQNDLIKIYQRPFPAIKNISDKGMKLINELNDIMGNPISLHDMGKLYMEKGRILEKEGFDKNPELKKEFNLLGDILKEIDKCSQQENHNEAPQQAQEIDLELE